MTFVARTIKEIEDALIADKEARAPLDILTSNSKVSVWRNMYFSIATGIHTLELAMERFQSDVETRADEITSGTLKWYGFESRVFQFGDALEFIDGNVTYAVIDEDKFIIDLAAADVVSGTILIKVAKLDMNGIAEPLTLAELTAFEDYWEEKRFAGTALTVISVPADEAIVGYRIGVDATVLNPLNGENLLNPLSFPVSDAINAFLQGFQAEGFNSILLLNKLTDAIQAVAGVKNVIPLSVQAKPNGGIYQEIVGTIEERYLARAGYIKVDETPGSTLNDTLQFYDFD